MARAAGCVRSDIPDSLHQLWDKFTEPGSDFSNQVSVLAQSPVSFTHLYGLVEALRSRSGLPPRLIEVAVVTVSRINQCPYCVAHHGATLVRHGLAQETVENILEADVPGLDERERTVRDYARFVTERAWGIPEAMFSRLRQHFDDQAIVELTVRICLTGLFNKFNQALEIDIEPVLQDEDPIMPRDVGAAAEGAP